MKIAVEIAALLLACAWRSSDAAHCYAIQGQAACEGAAGGLPCAFCNGQCQMASDACYDVKSQDQLPGAPFFQDFTQLLSTNPTQKNYGISVTDIDNDGHFEFVVAGFGAPNQAFKWDAATQNFKDIAPSSAVLQDASGMAIGLAACDVDGDGYEELYVLNTDSYSGQTGTSDKLFDRDSSGTYSDKLAGANYVAGRSCACVDRSGNGRYGVMVANYGGPMRLYEMPSGGQIKDVAPDAGVDKTTGGRALIAGPLVTNRMDIFANNEGYGGGRLLSTNASRRLSHRLNYLFAQEGDGTFTDIALDVGLLDASQTGRGTAFIDANGDGLLDVVYGNWNGPHRLFVQEKDSSNCPKFVDKAPTDMMAPSPIRTVIVADFDNDGYEEIFWNNIPGANRLFRKLPTDADWTSVKIGDALEESGYGTGAAVGDFDGDGLLELVIAHGESASQPLSYFRPKGGVGNHYLRVLPLTPFGAPARGAKVTLVAGGRSQVRVIDAGSGYLCQMEPVAHFGLGSITVVDSITITWPDGAAHAVTNPQIDQLLRVERPEGLATPAFQGHCSTSPSPAPVAAAAPVPAPVPAEGQHKPSGVTEVSNSNTGVKESNANSAVKAGPEDLPLQPKEEVNTAPASATAPSSGQSQTSSLATTSEGVQWGLAFSAIMGTVSMQLSA